MQQILVLEVALVDHHLMQLLLRELQIKVLLLEQEQELYINLQEQEVQDQLEIIGQQVLEEMEAQEFHHQLQAHQ